MTTLSRRTVDTIDLQTIVKAGEAVEVPLHWGTTRPGHETWTLVHHREPQDHHREPQQGLFIPTYHRVTLRWSGVESTADVGVQQVDVTLCWAKQPTASSTLKEQAVTIDFKLPTWVLEVESGELFSCFLVPCLRIPTATLFKFVRIEVSARLANAKPAFSAGARFDILTSKLPNDVHIVFPREPGRSLWANGTILAGASPYFKTRLAAGFSETTLPYSDISGEIRGELSFEDSDDDSDDEYEQPAAATATHNPHSRIKITSASYRIYRAVIYWIYTGKCIFTPFLSISDPSLTQGARKEALASFLADYAAKHPHLPLPSSPKSTYRLVHFLEIELLKELALEAIRRQFSPANVADTIFSETSGSYSDILSAALDFASKRMDELKASAGWKRKLDEMEDSEWGTRVLKQVATHQHPSDSRQTRRRVLLTPRSPPAAMSISTRSRRSAAASKTEDVESPPGPASDVEAPTVELSGLPAETKARICFYVSEQDREHKERWAPGAPGADIAKELATQWHGRGLRALSETDKTFNTLCAKYLFRVVLAKQTVGPAFRNVIIPSQAANIRSIDVRDTDAKASKQALGALHLLPNLDSLLLDYIAATRLFGDVTLLDPAAPVGESDDSDFRRIAFRQAAVRIRALTLESFSPVHLPAVLLAGFNDLRSLTITSKTDITPSQMARILERVPYLTDLQFAMASSPAESWAAVQWPALGSVTIDRAVLDDNTLGVLGILASSLQTLCLHLKVEQNPTSPTPPPFKTSFPRLTHLTLTNIPHEKAIAILQSLGTQDVRTPLSTINIIVRNFHGHLYITSGKSFLAFESTIQVINVQMKGKGTPYLHDSPRLGQIPGLVINSGRKVDPFQPLQRRPLDEGTSPALVQQYVEVMTETLKFGLRHLEQLEEEGNHSELSKAFEVLDKLRVWQRLAEE